MRHARVWLTVCLALSIAMGAAAWLATSVKELHDRLAAASPWLAVGFVVFAVTVAGIFGTAAARILWKLSSEDRPTSKKAPESVVKAADVQAEQAAEVIAKIKDDPARAILEHELKALKNDWEAKRFHVVVFGNVSAGKTSLINALIGREVGRTEAVMGTTRAGENHTYTVEDVDGTVLLTDTPGMSEAGVGGVEREAEARNLAARADLLLFVVDHDLTRTEYEPLVALARQGKRSILVLNKKDRYTDEDRAAILAKLRERLAGVIGKDDIACVAADPRPIQVRLKRDDGSYETAWETEPPDLSDLRARIARVLEREGDHLRAGNLLLRAHLVSQQARDQLSTERDAKAQGVIDKFQWITAGTVFTNPLPALDLLATGAVQFQMISEIAAAYGIEMNSAHARMVGGQMIQLLLKLGIVEASTSLVAGLFKSTLAGYAAGGAIQGVSMAYLTHVSGHAFMEYFRAGQSWGDGGMQAALEKQYQLARRADFLKEFAQQALGQVKSRLFSKPSEEVAGRN